MQLGKTLVYLFILSGCASAPSLEQFNKTILPSLAEERANARVDWLQATARNGKWSPEMVSLLAGAIARNPAIGSALGSSAAEFVNRHVEDRASRLDAIRAPLKEEMLTIFARRSRLVEDVVQVCVEGTERRYQWQEKQFQRISDGPGPCEQTPLSTLGHE